jgi:hypothetical protein
MRSYQNFSSFNLLQVMGILLLAGGCSEEVNGPGVSPNNVEEVLYGPDCAESLSESTACDCEVTISWEAFGGAAKAVQVVMITMDAESAGRAVCEDTLTQESLANYQEIDVASLPSSTTSAPVNLAGHEGDTAYVAVYGEGRTLLGYEFVAVEASEDGSGSTVVVHTL